MEIAMSKSQLKEMKEYFVAAADVGYKCGLANMARTVIQLIGHAEDCEIIDEPAANEVKKTIRMAEQAYLLKRWEKEEKEEKEAKEEQDG